MFYHFKPINRIKNLRSAKRAEIKKLVLKNLLKDPYFSDIERFYFGYKLSSFSKKHSFTNFRRSCVISNYPRSFVRRFKLSRHTAKYYASKGLLIGMRKSSF